MKILMLGWELPPHNSGGLGVACYQLAKALAGRGAQIDFMMPTPPQPITHDFMRVLPIGRKIKDAHSLSYSGDTHTITKIQDNYLDNIRYYAAHEPHPDIIHSHDWLTLRAGVLAKQLMNRPLVAHVHATEFDRAGGHEGSPIIHDIEKHGLMMADRIIAVSHYTRRLIVQRYGIPADKIDVVHNSFSLDDLAPADRVSYNYLDMLHREGFTLVSTLGRLTVQKGLYQFLDGCAKAVRKHDKMAFIIAGDGEQRNELVERSAELGISSKTIFTGFVRGNAWRQIYELSDIFVMSSVSEPFGITALEAAAHDTPVVITKSSGASEVLTHSFKYDYWDTDRLADIIVNVAESKSLAKTMIANTRQELTSLSWENLADSCIAAYQRTKLGSLST